MTNPANAHSVLIAQAAKSILRPLGLFQKGRSRTWLGDHGWWLEVVEFQPSGWSKGAYLNVGCMWLWNVKSTLSFDEGYRTNGFEPFETEEQFRSVAALLGRRAEERILFFRAQFPAIRAVSDYYIQKPPMNSFWPVFNAAVAHGLCGRGNEGSALLRRIVGALDLTIQWQKDADADARYLLDHIQNKGRLRKLISERIFRTRELQRLQPITEVEFDTALS